jgi:hypothetical protein
MHLLIPFASTMSEACVHTLADLQLPHLSRLLARLTAARLDAGDEDRLSMPHERAIGHALGWQAADGLLPWAAFHATADGIEVGLEAWGELTPVHVHVATDQITLLDPQVLQLDSATSKAFFESVRDLFQSAGWRVEWGGDTRWYTAHASLVALPTASLDRVVGRSVDPWSPKGPQARAIRGLQNEVQMLLYQLPMNDERVARGQLPMNSFWVSGCGPRQPAAAIADLTVAEHLRPSALAGDWASYAEAWRALDAGPVAHLLQASESGDPVQLTLCGERNAQTFETRPQSVWRNIARRLQSFNPNPILETL